MEVKPGYEETDAGVIPEEWECGKLEEYLSFISYGFTNPMPTVEQGIFMVTAADINEGRLQLETARKTTEAAYRTLLSPKSKPKKNDILLTKDGSLGRLALVGDQQICINQSVAVLRPNERVEPTFLKLLLESPRHQAKMIEDAGGSTIKHIYITVVNLMAVGLPPRREEQRAIAEALGDMDALLVGLDRLIAKKRDLKQAAMQQLLTGQTRLPGFQGEWEETTLFDLAERRKELFDDGDWIESEHITTDGIRLIQTGNIGVGRFVEKDARKFIYEESFTSLRCKQVKIGDLLICRLADPAGRACVLPDIGDERVVTSVDVTIFRPPPEKVDRVFLANVFSTPEWFRTVSDRSGGTTHKRISRGALGRLLVSLPPRPEQAAIAAVLSDMDAELTALDARRDKTRALKQGMMQELLTGRTRLI